MKLSRCAVLLSVAAAAGANAGVVQVSPGGFLVRHEAAIGVSPAKVYDALVHVGSWWNADHTFSGDAKNLSIDPRAGGCFCEKVGDGGVEHLRVTHVAPGRLLRMSGALGPLQASGVAGSMTWKLAPSATGTKIELAYSVGGFIEDGFDKWAPAVDGVLGEQLQRLKLFAETGKPTATP